MSHILSLSVGSALVTVLFAALVKKTGHPRALTILESLRRMVK